jgi:hypothetical protein
MPYSAPMKAVSTWLSPEEKAALVRLAEDRNLTLAYVLREGARLYARDIFGHDVERDDAPMEGQLAL